MPRPIKYLTHEDRLKARREQTAHAVRRYREHQKQLKALDDHIAIVNGKKDAISAAISQLSEEEALATIQLLMSSDTLMVVPDFGRHTFHGRISCYPDVIASMARTLNLASTSYPYESILKVLGPSHQMIQLGVFAFGASLFGILQNDSKMIGWGESAYRQLLPGMRNALENPRKNCPEALVTVILNSVLKGVEVMNCYRDNYNPGRCRYIIHHRYSPKIVESCGPLAFRGEVGLHILRLMRRRIVFISFYTCQATFLDSEEWRRMPFFGTQLTSSDRLWHTIEKIPGLAQRMRYMHWIHNCKHVEDVRSAWDKIVELKSCLDSWMESYADCWGSACFPHVTNAFAFDMIEGGTITFPTRDMATDLSAYWFHLFVLATLATDFWHEHSDILNSGIAADTLLKHEDISNICWRLCQTLLYLIRHPDQDLEILLYIIIYPNRMLISYFSKYPKTYSKELEWCKAFSTHIANRNMTCKMSEFFWDGYFPQDGSNDMDIWRRAS